MDREQSLRVVLKETRRKLGVTQESLADSSRCSRSLIAGIEKGSLPSASTLRRIIQAVPENDRSAIENTSEARTILQGAAENAETQHDYSKNMVLKFRSLRGPIVT